MGPDLSAYLTLILQLLQTLPIAQSAEHSVNAQQQAMQRQLSASDMAGDPARLMAHINRMLGTPSNPNAPVGTGGNASMQQQLQQLLKQLTPNNPSLAQLQSQLTPQIENSTMASVMQKVNPQLQAMGMTQAPGVAAEEMATALGPMALQEQQIGAGLAEGQLGSLLQGEQLGSRMALGEQQGATNLENSALQYPFNIGSGAAGQYPVLSQAFI